MCIANIGKEMRGGKSVREKVNMYSGADVEITVETARGRRLRTMYCIYIICTLKLSSRIFVTYEIAAAPCRYIYICVNVKVQVLGYSDFTCRHVLYSISTFDAAKYNIFNNITLYLSGVARE